MNRSPQRRHMHVGPGLSNSNRVSRTSIPGIPMERALRLVKGGLFVTKGSSIDEKWLDVQILNMPGRYHSGVVSTGDLCYLFKGEESRYRKNRVPSLGKVQSRIEVGRCSLLCI